MGGHCHPEGVTGNSLESRARQRYGGLVLFMPDWCPDSRKCLWFMALVEAFKSSVSASSTTRPQAKSELHRAHGHFLGAQKGARAMPKITAHPGVSIIKRKRNGSPTRYRLKWTDGNGKTKWETLDPSLTAAQRVKVAIERSHAAETPTPDGVLLTDALDAFFERKQHEVKENTLRSYRKTARLMKKWGGQRNTKTIDLPALTAFRTSVITPERAPATVNSHLLGARCILNDLRRSGQTPALSSDDIKDGLRGVRAQKPLKCPLTASELQGVFSVARRHDNALGKRQRPILPFLATTLLTGARINEVLSLEWGDVDLDKPEIVIRADKSKTGYARRIPLDICPTLINILRHEQQVDSRVFPDWNFTRARAARERLIRMGAPEFTYQRLRQTCGTFLTCAPRIYGGASAFMSAARLGHSVMVAERHYVGALRVNGDALTLEDAMEISNLLK